MGYNTPRHHKLFWGSSYDRGLQYLLFMWSDIKKAFPDAELHICYGWDLFLKVHSNNPERMEWKRNMDVLMEQEGIYHYGRVGKEELKKIRQECGIWAYPTDFTEINCHPAGTFIETKEGDKPIEKISLSDFVRTSKGVYRQVIAVRSREYQGEIIKIVPQCGEPLFVTPDHMILVIKSTKLDTSRNFEEIIKKSPEWILAKDIKEHDIVLASRKMEKNNFVINIDDYIGIVGKKNFPQEENQINTILDEDKIWWFGYFIGDGNANNVGKISCLVSNKYLEKYYKKVLAGFKSFGLKTFERQLRGCLEIYAHSRNLSRFLKDKFYDNEKNKKIPQELLSIGGETLLDGLMAADGSICSVYKGKGILKSYTSKSRKLISQVRFLLNSLGIAAKIGTRRHKDGKISYWISWVEYGSKKLNFYLAKGNFLYYKVRKIEQQPFYGRVYNIDVDQEHNYHANGIIVHNCTTALDCQADGCVPVVMNFKDEINGEKVYTALEETVQAGIKVEGDIRTEEGRKAYLEALLKLMKDKKTWKKLSIKGRKFAKKFWWKKIAEQWYYVLKTPKICPLVSVYTPTIREGWWNIMADNLAKQTYGHFEWIIVDDYKENRREIAEKYAKKYNLNIRYYRGKKALGTSKRKCGLVQANNLAWKVASGELLVCLQDFILMPENGLEKLVYLHLHNPDCLIAPVDIYYFVIQPDKSNKEDWWSGETDIFLKQSWRNPRVKFLGIRETANPYDFEMNYGAIPMKILKELNGWWEFMDDGLGYDNTEIAFRALEKGYRILVDDTNIAKCVNLWPEIKGTNQNILNRERMLNPPRYLWLVEMTQKGKLPLRRDEKLDERIFLPFEVPKKIKDEDCAEWIEKNTEKIIGKWREVL